MMSYYCFMHRCRKVLNIGGGGGGVQGGGQTFSWLETN